jgi:hypothetical protein
MRVLLNISRPSLELEEDRLSWTNAICQGPWSVIIAGWTMISILPTVLKRFQIKFRTRVTKELISKTFK